MVGVRGSRGGEGLRGVEGLRGGGGQGWLGLGVVGVRRWWGYRGGGV